MQRCRERGLTLLEVALVVSLGGTLLAIAVPAFVRELHASRFAEPVEGLGRLGAQAVAYAEGRPPGDAFPPSAPLTPKEPPRGAPAVDPEGTWSVGTWRLLDFLPVREGAAHSYAFAFDNAAKAPHDADGAATTSHFVAAAHGDLDGDGTRSTFEIRGTKDANVNGGAAMVDPGMYVEAELE